MFKNGYFNILVEQDFLICSGDGHVWTWNRPKVEIASERFSGERFQILPSNTESDSGVRISSTFSVLRPFSYLRPFLYFDPPTLLRPKLYFDLFTSTRASRPIRNPYLTKGRSKRVQRSSIEVKVHRSK